MFLTRVHQEVRRRLDAQRDNDRGVALIVVIGVMAVLMIISASVASSAITAAGFATATRASVQSFAAADAGVDAVQAKLMGGTFVCSLTGTSPTFSAVVSYTDSNNAALTCAANTLSGTPAHARITSTGTANSTGIAKQSNGDTATVGATTNLVVTPGGVSFDQALFTDSGLTLTNNTTINQSASGALDGSVYSNGALTCQTANLIQGTIYARAGLTVTNTCQALSTVWVSGNVDLSQSSVNLGGNLFATGTATLGVGHVGGSVIANGNVSLSDASNIGCSSGGSANVCGSVYSLNGSVTLGQNGPKVLGGIYSRGAVSLGANSSSPAQDLISLTSGVSGNQNGSGVGGFIKVATTWSNIQPTPTTTKTCATQSGYTPCTTSALTLPLPTAANPAFTVPQPLYTPTTATNLGTAGSTTTVTAPTRQGMPQISGTAAAIATNWTGWTLYTVPSSSNLCSSSYNQSFTASFNSLMATYAVGTKILLNMSACTGGVSLAGDTLSLRGDLAIMSNYGFNSNNGLTVNSSDGAAHSLLLIVPSDTRSGLSWTPADANYPGQLSPSCSSGYNISLNSLSVGNGDKVFMYTPCQVSIQNTSTFAGQIYSGSGSYPSGLNITRAIFTVPGATVPGGPSSNTTYSSTITSRYDTSK